MIEIIRSVTSHQEQLKELKSIMQLINHGLNEPYFLSSFIGGLDEELRLTMKIFKP